MAHNGTIWVNIENVRNPTILPVNENGDRDFNQLCSEIYSSLRWPVTDELLIEGNYHFKKNGQMVTKIVTIMSDSSFKLVANRATSLDCDMELFVKRVQNHNIGSSSRSNVRVDNDDEEEEDENEVDEENNADPLPDIRVNNDEIPHVHDDGEDEDEVDTEPERESDDESEVDTEEEVDDGGEDEDEVDEETVRANDRRNFRYNEEDQMAHVGTFGYPPAKEFENIDGWEHARVNIQYGMTAHAKGELFKKQTFKTKSELQFAVRFYCLKQHREIVVERSSKSTYGVTCSLKNQGCLWRLWASVNNQNLWEIKKLRVPHTCRHLIALTNHKQLTSTVVAGIIINTVRSDLSVKPVSIIEIIKLDPKYTISYWKAWKAKQKAIKFLFGEWKEAYNLLPELMRAIDETNEDLFWEFKDVRVVNEKNEADFEGLFWAFGPSLKGFKYCKPVVTIDGTFLTGKYKGVLLTAIGSDANDHLYPVAFALVEKESTDTWSWFMDCLRRSLADSHPELCVISDRHPGIINTMKRAEWIEPFGHHRYCMRHLQANLCDYPRLKDKSVVPMLACLIRANTQHDFNNILEAIKDKDKNAITWLKSIETRDNGRHKYALSYDEGGRRWGMVTSNNSEIMNFVFKGIRKLPVTAIVMGTFYKVNQYRVKYRRMAEERGAIFSTELNEKLEESGKLAATYNVEIYDYNGGVYGVTGTHFITNTLFTFRVDVPQDGSCKCECQEPMLYHIPCSHVIAVCTDRGVSHLPYVHPCFSTDYFKKTYEHCFAPIKDKEFWPQPDENRPILVPGESLARKTKGRYKTRRFKNSMDTMLNEPSRKNHCSICKRIGHTKRSCTRPGGGKHVRRGVGA